MKDAAELLTAISALIGIGGLVTVLCLFRKEIKGVLTGAGEIGVKVLGNEFTFKPTQAERKPEQDKPVLPSVSEDQPIPADYLYLNHTSFLRKDKQPDFQARTGIPLDHYDIRVHLDSCYAGALDRVQYVVYLLHEAYPEPVQARSNRKDKFLLKELANGEYVLLAKVFLKDRAEPILLQRYITLWKDGPRLS